jgi:hypothetical protein
MPFAPFFGQPAQGTASASPTASAKPAGAAGGGSAQPGAGVSGADAGAATGMPAAMAWWNVLQDQFTQAVASAMTPSAATGSTATASAATDGKDAAKPATPQPQAQPAVQDVAPDNGNAKPRAGKPKSDKS